MFQEEQNSGAMPLSSPQNKPSQKRWDKIVTILLVVAVVALVVTLCLKAFVVGRIVVSGDSMLPNYQNQQVVWVSKTAKVQRGDVVVFYTHDVNKLQAEFFGNGGRGQSAEKYIKRVVALAGDKLWVEQQGNDFVLVIQTPDGLLLRENYYTVYGRQAAFLASDGTTCDIPTLGTTGNLGATSASNPYVVAENCFFALGDNRHNSTDSRKLGDIPLSRLYGVVMQ